jgi:PTH1 family peptidyl-tRNA hydrolase
MGFAVVNRIAKRYGVTPMRERPYYAGAIAGLDLEGEDIHELILVRPTTFMNRSGLAVRAVLEEFGLTSSQMLVVADDFNLPLGTLRFRPGGSDGGHNGLASIIETLETEAFPRLRLGIGPLPEGAQTVDFVLSRFAPSELERVEKMVAQAAKAAIFAVLHRLEEAMSQFNHSPACPEDS